MKRDVNLIHEQPLKPEAFPMQPDGIVHMRKRTARNRSAHGWQF